MNRFGDFLLLILTAAGCFAAFIYVAFLAKDRVISPLFIPICIIFPIYFVIIFTAQRLHDQLRHRSLLTTIGIVSLKAAFITAVVMVLLILFAMSGLFKRSMYNSPNHSLERTAALRAAVTQFKR